jgi:hypothetical protein
MLSGVVWRCLALSGAVWLMREQRVMMAQKFKASRQPPFI